MFTILYTFACICFFKKLIYNNLIKFSIIADHIFDKIGPEMEALGLECECLGGGKIEHNSQDKKMRVFGESTVSFILMQN